MNLRLGCPGDRCAGAVDPMPDRGGPVLPPHRGSSPRLLLARHASWESGDVESAAGKAKAARIWAWVTFGLGALAYIVIIGALLLLGAFS